MRVYQLVNTTATYSYNPNRAFDLYITNISNLMNSKDFLKYIQDYCLKHKIFVNNFKMITIAYLDSLCIGNTMLAPNLDIRVYYIPVKTRVYSLDNGNDLYPIEYNVSAIDKFKTVLSTFYNELTVSHQVSVKQEDIINDSYLESLPVGHNHIRYNYIYSDGSESKEFNGFNIIVSEFEV